MSAALESVFDRVAGAGTLVRLRHAMRPRPLWLLGGDQLTGKSVTARLLAAAQGGSAGSTGNLVRHLAELEGCTLDAKTRHLAAFPDADARLDYEALFALARGTWLVYECRMAGHLGLLLRRAGHNQVRTIRLTCRPREQALRWVERNLGAPPRFKLEAAWPFDDGRPLSEWLAMAVESLGLSAEWSISIRSAADRDARDRARLHRLYAVDYADPSAFDRTLATDGLSPKDVTELAAKATP